MLIANMMDPPLSSKLERIRSASNQQQTVVVLNSVETTIQEHNAQPSPTEYFVALLALLNQAVGASGAINKELATSIVHLLDIVLPFTTKSILRAKFTNILSLLAPLLILEDGEAPLLRPSIGCLESLLVAQDSTAWDLSAAEVSPRRAVIGLLKVALDPRPKVRKRAQEALKHVLKNPPPSPSLDHPAADLCAETAMTSLRDLANRSIQLRKERRSSERIHDPNLMHALQLTKAIASASGGWPSRKIEPLCEQLLSIAKTGNEHMTMAVFEVFEIVFAAVADDTASSKLPRLLEILSELRPAFSDTQLLPPWIAILSRAYDVAGQVEPDDTFQKLPELFTMVSQFLESPFENIRVSASECLVSLMANCVPPNVIFKPSVYDDKVLEKLARVVEGLLTVQYQMAWLETFKVLSAMFNSLHWRASPSLVSVTRTVGEIRGSNSFVGKKEADEVLGRAIRAMGPECVLSVLPLNLAHPAKGEPGRAWLLPLLRDYTANTRLAHFRSHLVPLSETMFQRVLEHGDAEKTMEIKIYETVVQQIWSTLPGYCDLPLDLTEAFDQTFAEYLSTLLYRQVDMRLEVSRALRNLVESNQTIAALEDPLDNNMVLQSRVSQDDAKRNLAHLTSFASNILAVLFNVYSQTLPKSRGLILQTINAYLSITNPTELTETFDRVRTMLASSLQETRPTKQGKAGKPEDQLPSTAQTLMDLVITMSVHLPRESFASLFEIAEVIIVKDDDAQLQKKAYKLIPRLAASTAGRMALQERHGEVQTLLLSSAEKVSAPARRERLAALASLIPLIPDDSLHFIPSVLSEVVICCKERNDKARETAYELLILMGRRMSSANGVLIQNNLVPHMPETAPAVPANVEEYFTMVSAGLAGSTPHMISATITAITRTLYEFREDLSKQTLTDLVQTMDLFLTSNNREIVKSVLGFVKVCVLSLPGEMMKPILATLIPRLMVWSHEHKGHFRAKVKHILERMVRRFGIDVVNRHCPEDDRKLITNIRKTNERSRRRKDATREGVDEEGSGNERPHKRTTQFESEFDEALYSSSSESDDSDEELITKPAKGRSKRGHAYITEDVDEPLDLLDRKALANISSTKPAKIGRPGRTKAKVNLEGKLMLGQNSDDEGAAMEVDGPDMAEANGVGAYVAALRGKDIPRRGLKGKLKFSNKVSKADENEDDDGMTLGQDHAAVIKSKLTKGNSPRHQPRAASRPRGGRAGKGGIGTGRRGLGQDKRRGQPVARASVSKRGRR